MGGRLVSAQSHGAFGGRHSLCFGILDGGEQFEQLGVVGAGLCGGLGIVPGANIGAAGAVFEAVHGSAPDIAGQGIANPTALVQSAVMMLHHIGESAAGRAIEKALTTVYARGDKKTGDLGGRASTREFTDALCEEIERG